VCYSIPRPLPPSLFATVVQPRWSSAAMLVAHVRRGLPLCQYYSPLSKKEKRCPTRPTRPKSNNDRHSSRGREPPTVVQSRPNSGKRSAAAPPAIGETGQGQAPTQPPRAPIGCFLKPIPSDSIVATSEHGGAAIYIRWQSLRGDPGHVRQSKTKGRGAGEVQSAARSEAIKQRCRSWP
jgi:hypothetical protein